MKYEIGDRVCIKLSDVWSSEYEYISGEVIDRKKSFFFGEEYKVEWRVKSSWDGRPPFRYYYKSKWFSVYKIKSISEV